jgi:hypothetical protein
MTLLWAALAAWLSLSAQLRKDGAQTALLKALLTRRMPLSRPRSPFAKRGSTGRGPRLGSTKQHGIQVARIEQ